MAVENLAGRAQKTLGVSDGCNERTISIIHLLIHGRSYHKVQGILVCPFDPFLGYRPHNTLTLKRSACKHLKKSTPAWRIYLQHNPSSAPSSHTGFASWRHQSSLQSASSRYLWWQRLVRLHLVNSSRIQVLRGAIVQGKVREIYEAGNDTLLLVTSDRISAYDVILKNGVQDKGAVLTLLTNHWLNTVMPEHVPGLKHHLVSLNIPRSLDLSPEQRKTLRGRSMLVRKYRVFPIEAIGLSPAYCTPALRTVQLILAVLVRGYITGSSWSEYKQKGTVHGMTQPSGLEQCQAFPNGPIYTPSSKLPHHSLAIAQRLGRGR